MLGKVGCKSTANYLMLKKWEENILPIPISSLWHQGSSYKYYYTNQRGNKDLYPHIQLKKKTVNYPFSFLNEFHSNDKANQYLPYNKMIKVTLNNHSGISWTCTVNLFSNFSCRMPLELLNRCPSLCLATGRRTNLRTNFCRSWRKTLTWDLVVSLGEMWSLFWWMK